ncbi:MAG: TolC family protein [Candidatus Omnitrophica bacterium]|nr:TolC family protein [Candidatus Omnitrophota bacterium]MDD5488484.1 TolC family protein [Candidatus Omnitrophota bacterium]
MNKKITYTLLVCASAAVLCLVKGVSAEDRGALTWKDCVLEAIEHNPDLEAAFERIKQAKADRDIVISGAAPQVTGSGSGSRSKSSGRKEANSFSYGVTGQQLVFDGFKTSSEVSAAIKTMEAARYDLDVVSSDIRLNLRDAFATLLRAQELVGLTENIAERRKQSLELVRLRYKAGREHRGALLTAEADLAQAEFEVAQAERNISLAQRGLIKALGRERFSPIKVQGDFQVKEVGRVKPDLENLADTTPLLMELIARKEASKFGVMSAESDFFPQVYLNTSLGETASDWPPRKEEWSAGVSVSLPIFEGGSRIANVAKTKAKLRESRADERSGRDGVLLTLEGAWKDLQDAMDSVSVKEKFLQATQERAKIADAQYSTGLISFDDWIIIEDNLVSAKKDFLNAQATVLTAEATWVQAKGGTLEYDKK